jgi:hypothetical protein
MVLRNRLLESPVVFPQKPLPLPHGGNLCAYTVLQAQVQLLQFLFNTCGF